MPGTRISTLINGKRRTSEITGIALSPGFIFAGQANNEVRRSEQLARQGFNAPIKVETDRLATLGAQREVEAAAAERPMAAHELEQTQAALSVVRQPAAGA